MFLRLKKIKIYISLKSDITKATIKITEQPIDRGIPKKNIQGTILVG